MKRMVHLWLWALLLAAVWVMGCGKSEVDEKTEVPPEVLTDLTNCEDDGTTLQLLCPALPYTNARGELNQGGVLDYDIFAWNSFIAMNWPALDPATNNNQRGFPDVQKTFATAASDDLLVWETYKEKREIFLADPFTGTPVANPQVEPWNARPAYGPSGKQVPLCPGVTGSGSTFERHITQAIKLNTLDETAEVASEARETNQVLCQGHSGCDVHGKSVGPRVWFNRDGASLPVLYEVKVNWDFYNYLDTFPAGKLWVQANARAAAPQGIIRLPARTSGGSAPPRPGTALHKGGVTPAPHVGPNPIVTDYHPIGCSIQAGLVGPSTNQTPCPAGSVHLKAAWVPLDAPSDEYHTTMAYYYRDYTPTAGQPGYPEANKCKAPAYYGLVGLHIIQRIHELADERYVQAPGGNFIFATWEHVGNDSANLTYANLFPTTSPTPQPYPNVAPASAIPLKRAYAPLASTELANQQVHQALGCGGASESVWCNYKLIGTQYKAANGPPAGFDVANPPEALPATPYTTGNEFPPNSGQPYFLANLVVESNVGLQQFLGMPPRVTTIDHYAHPRVPPGTGTRVGNRGVPSNPAGTFDLAAANLAFRIAPRSEPAFSADTSTRNHHQTIIHNSMKHGTNGSSNKNPASGALGRKVGAHNMGGCMGCHGVAQLKGYSFSFVLLGNQEGGVPDTLTHLEIPPPPTSN